MKSFSALLLAITLLLWSAQSQANRYGTGASGSGSNHVSGPTCKTLSPGVVAMIKDKVCQLKSFDVKDRASEVEMKCNIDEDHELVRIYIPKSKYVEASKKVPADYHFAQVINEVYRDGKCQDSYTDIEHVDRKIQQKNVAK